MEPGERSGGPGRGPGGEPGSEEAFAWAAKLTREPARSGLFVPLVVLLTLASIPFYWSWLGGGGRWLGLPAWVWVTVACSAGISGVTAWGALRHWRDEDSGAAP